jgi:PncC family amidohydrolase
MGVDIGVKVRALSRDELSKKVKAVEEIFNSSPLKKNIWNFGPETIEEKIVKLATTKKIRFGFAESATGGLCSHRITNIAGSSSCFMGSIISYDEEIKKLTLNVQSSTLEHHSAVSLETAKEMAKGLKSVFKLDIAISITGYAGPSGEQIGLAFIGRGTDQEITATEIIPLKGDREVVKMRFSQAALYALLEEVEAFAGI